jgi:hypothetical protein
VSGPLATHASDAVEDTDACVPRSIAFYRRGQRWVDSLPLRDQPSLWQHGRFLADLERRGLALHAGPVHRLDDVTRSDLIGVASFTVDADAARLLLRDDPALMSELLACDVVAWFVTGA